MKRFVDIIDLVKTARERMLQSGSRPGSHIFKLHDDSGNKAKVSFEEGSPAFDIETSITLRYDELRKDDNAICEFIRQYGWSVKSFIAPRSFGDCHAQILDEDTRDRGSRIERLDIDPLSLTDLGLNSMNRVIDRSRGLAHLRLCLGLPEQGQTMDKVLCLLEKHKDRLTSVSSTIDENTISQITQVFPNRARFPLLEEFVVKWSWNDKIYDVALQWITSVVSARSPAWNPLKVFGLSVNLRWQDWEDVIMALDLSTLEELSLDNSYFAHDQLEFLVNRIAVSGASSLPLKLLDLRRTNVRDNPNTRVMFAKVQDKAPQVKEQINIHDHPVQTGVHDPVDMSLFTL